MFGLSNSTLKKYFFDPSVPQEQLELRERGMIWGAYFVGGFSAFCCFVIMLLALGPVYKQLKCESWPTTNGQIISSEPTDTDGSYGFSINYAYQVDGVSYIGDKVSYLDFNTAYRPYSVAVLQKYPIGTKTTVHYDPTNPGKSVLQLEIDWGYLGFPLLCFLMAIGGLVFGGFGARMAKRAFARRRALMASD